MNTDNPVENQQPANLATFFSENKKGVLTANKFQLPVKWLLTIHQLFQPLQIVYVFHIFQFE